jgi:hypothetical protein
VTEFWSPSFIFLAMIDLELLSQDMIIARLSGGEGFADSAPQRIDTHISVIFLSGDFAYKLKRAIHTSYLDYTTLALRREFCEKEIEINSRTAPKIYVDAVPVLLTPAGKLTIGEGDGEIVEWLVRMHRFPQSALLDRIVDKKGLAPSLVSALAKTIAEFHQSAEPRPSAPALRRIELVIEENAVELAHYTNGLLPPDEIKDYLKRCRDAVSRLSGVIERRGAEGRIRRCHGDLHLGNICLLDGQPVIFDAIEFNPDFTDVDVMFDASFLLMDLLSRGLGPQANMLFNRYICRTRDHGDLSVLPLFMALRAGIRAHTSAMAAMTAAKEHKSGLESKAHRYLELGISLLQRKKPLLVAVGGLSGTGKSSVSTALAPHFGPAPGALVISSDWVRKRQFGVEPTFRLDADCYLPEVDRRVYDEMFDIASDALASGHAVILDGTFRGATDRRMAAELAKKHGVRFTGLWLDADFETMNTRILGRSGDASDATIAILKKQVLDPPRDIEWDRLDVSGTAADVARLCRRQVLVQL